MDALNLDGRTLRVGIGDSCAGSFDLPGEMMGLARVVATQSEGLALAVLFGVGPASSEYAVISPRYEGGNFKDLLKGKTLLCAVTLVPKNVFSLENPFDVSWWRGGGACIADVVLER